MCRLARIRGLSNANWVNAGINQEMTCGRRLRRQWTALSQFVTSVDPQQLRSEKRSYGFLHDSRRRLLVATEPFAIPSLSLWFNLI